MSSADFPHWLRAMRESHGLSMDELCAQFNNRYEAKLNKSTISRYENGLQEPIISTVAQMAEFFGAPTPLLSTARITRPAKRSVALPILGVIRAGLPILAEENYDGDVDVGCLRGDYVLRVTGDSMVYAGIHDGDMVVIRQQDYAQSGQIVAAAVCDGFSDYEATLKYYISEPKSSPVLRAANPAYKDQPFTANHRILGIFAGLLREGDPGVGNVQDLVLRSDRLSDSWALLASEATAAGLEADDVMSVLGFIKKMKIRLE